MPQLPTRRPLTLSERRKLKRRLGEITDALAALDRRERELRDARRELRVEQARLTQQVYRS